MAQLHALFHFELIRIWYQYWQSRCTRHSPEYPFNTIDDLPAEVRTMLQQHNSTNARTETNTTSHGELDQVARRAGL